MGNPQQQNSDLEWINSSFDNWKKLQEKINTTTTQQHHANIWYIRPTVTQAFTCRLVPKFVRMGGGDFYIVPPPPTPQNRGGHEPMSPGLVSMIHSTEIRILWYERLPPHWTKLRIRKLQHSYWASGQWTSSFLKRNEHSILKKKHTQKVHYFCQFHLSHHDL